MAKMAVSRVRFNGKTGVCHCATKNEVVVAARAVHAPQFPQLSGMDDAMYLEKLNIQSIIDLSSICQNLRDHLVLEFALVLNTP